MLVNPNKRTMSRFPGFQNAALSLSPTLTFYILGSLTNAGQCNNLMAYREDMMGGYLPKGMKITTKAQSH
jgi:hypothetical protein